MSLKSGSLVSVDLPNDGENKFHVSCFDESGTAVKLEQSEITIVKTLINIGKIPCAHSVGVEIEDPITQKPSLDYLIRKDELLPKSGVVKYKTTKRISAGSSDFISFKLWEGEITDPIEYNRFIGDRFGDCFQRKAGCNSKDRYSRLRLCHFVYRLRAICRRLRSKHESF